MGTTDDERKTEGDDWPVSLTGATETIVATLGPNDRWNMAALGVFGPEDEEQKATARTWGNTRTKRNFHRQGDGYVQFTHDPEAFVDAALTIDERAEPILPSTQAWARVRVQPLETGTSGGTEWELWSLDPIESAIERRTVTPINRGFGAVIEATVAASRLGVPSYDQQRLQDRLTHCLEVVDRTGGPEERRAFATLVDETQWNPPERVRAKNEWL